MIKQFEQKLIRQYHDAVKSQNKIYFEMKAREYLSKSEEDDLAFAMAKMLCESLNLKVEDFLPSPQSKQMSVNKHMGLTTAPNT